MTGPYNTKASAIYKYKIKIMSLQNGALQSNQKKKTITKCLCDDHSIYDERKLSEFTRVKPVMFGVKN